MDSIHGLYMRRELKNTSNDAHALTEFNLSSRSDIRLGQGSREREGTNRRVPPAIHKVHPRCFSQVKRHAAGLQTDEEYGDVYVIHFEKNHFSL